MRTFLTVFKLDPSPLSSSSYPLLCLHSKILLLKSFGFYVKVHRPHFGPWPAFTYCPLWPWTPWTPVTQTPEQPFFPLCWAFTHILHVWSALLATCLLTYSWRCGTNIALRLWLISLPTDRLSFFLWPHSILFLLIAHFPNLLKTLT